MATEAWETIHETANKKAWNNMLYQPEEVITFRRLHLWNSWTTYSWQIWLDWCINHLVLRNETCKMLMNGLSTMRMFLDIRAIYHYCWRYCSLLLKILFPVFRRTLIRSLRTPLPIEKGPSHKEVFQRLDNPMKW